METGQTMSSVKHAGTGMYMAASGAGSLVFIDDRPIISAQVQSK